MTGSIRRQATALTLANGATRAVGFMMHLLLARLMGAEALGVMEMAHAVDMLALTPVTAGLPAAMSRLTAQRPACDRPEVLRAGCALVKRLALWLTPALLALSPLLALLLGDRRVLPSLLVSLPCIALLGLGAAYSGYCYGQGEAALPARNECVEQGVRFLLALALLWGLRRQSIAVTAALPGAAESVAALMALLLFRRSVPLPPSHAAPSQALQRELAGLAAPTVLSRLCATGMRAVSAVLLPVCLRRSGLTTAAATAQYGMLNGMAMPLMMLPGIVTNAISMVAAPAVSGREASPARLRPLVRKLYLAGAAVGLLSTLGLWALADFLAVGLYQTSALAPLLRLMAPTALLFGLQQVQYGMITGLGLQRRALTGTLAGSLAQLLLVALLTPLPRVRIFGAALAMAAGQAITLMWGWHVVRAGMRRASEAVA